jgi:hypothetical protein
MYIIYILHFCTTYVHHILSYMYIYTLTSIYTYSSREWKLKTNSSRTVVGLFVWDLSCHGPTEVLVGNWVQHILWYLYIYLPHYVWGYRPNCSSMTNSSVGSSEWSKFHAPTMQMDEPWFWGCETTRFHPTFGSAQSLKSYFTTDDIQQHWKSDVGYV